MRFLWECHAAHDDTNYISTLKDVVVQFYDIDDELQNCTIQIDLCYADNRKLVRGDVESPALTGKTQTLVGYDNSFKIKVNRTSFLCDRRKFCFWVHCIVDHIRYNWFLSPFQAVTKLNRKRTHTETEQTTSTRLSDWEDDLQEIRQQFQTQQSQIQVLTTETYKLILLAQELNTNVNSLMSLYRYMTAPM